jgi:hypothetical protein
LTCLTAALGLCLAAGGALAQEGWNARLSVGFDYQIDTDLDVGGEFDYWHTNVGLDAGRKLGESWRADLRTGYRAFGYDFSGLAGGIDPWDTIHVIRLNPVLTYLPSDKWQIWGGPIVEASLESGAVLKDAIRAGGLLGATYQWTESFSIGLGALAVNQIEDGAEVHPILILDWSITEALRFTTRSWTTRGGLFELIYGFGEDWELGLSGGFHRERFRLDSGPAAFDEGVGEDEATIASLRISRFLGKGVRLDLFGGLTLDGEFRLEDEDGDKVAKSDYDNAAFAGAAISIPF